MNFDLPDGLKALQLRTRRFIAEEVIPMERDLRQTAHGPSESLRLELIEKARRAGVSTPHRETNRTPRFALIDQRTSS